MILEQRILEEVNARAIAGRPPETVHHLRKYVVDRPRVWLSLFLRHLADMGRLELHAARRAQWNDDKTEWFTAVSIHPGPHFVERLEELRRRDRANRGAA